MKRVLIAVVIATAQPAFADDSEPWTAGVSAELQSSANALFAEGNKLFAQQAHAPALDKYKAAIALWDHPLIRFNMAVTEIRLDRILDAAEDLDQALRFGASPFTPALHQQAQDYHALLKKQVGKVEATCDQPGVQVLLDGKPWFTCPGTRTQRVLAGAHLIAGERKDFLTQSVRMIVAGDGKVTPQHLNLVSIDSAVVVTYRYRRWIPYTAASTGAAIALGGLAFWFSGRSQMDKYESDLTASCPNGCNTTSPTTPTERFLANEHDGARLKGTVGISMMAAGGAIALGGIVVVILNRPERVLPSLEVAPAANGGMSARVGWTF